MTKRHIGDQRLLTKHFPSDLVIAHSLAIQFKRLFSGALKVVDFFQQERSSVLSNISASREKQADVEGAELLQGSDDLPDVVIRPQRSVPAANISVSTEEPPLPRFVKDLLGPAYCLCDPQDLVFLQADSLRHALNRHASEDT